MFLRCWGIEACENVGGVALGEGVWVRHHHLVLEVLRLKVIRMFPELRDIFLFALADGALVIVAESLLGPKRALSFEIDFVSAEKWCSLELGEDGCESAIETLQFFDRCTRPIEVSLCDLGGTLGWVEVRWEVAREEV